MFAAARITDFHMCPMVTPGVFCRRLCATGTALCVRPPDLISTGSMTCFVGGLPAARIMDPEIHGGTIMLGEFTVLIGSQSEPAFQ
jgi:uncharacterized Zn-binding protein involved in type VI secretion